MERNQGGPSPAMTSSNSKTGHAQPDASVLVRMVDVTKSYRDIHVLKPVSLEINDGEFLTILGPSGSGKTTLLRMIGGFTEPTSGNIFLRDADIAHVPIFKRPFNTVFQDYALFPHMTVARNVGYGLRIRRLSRSEIERRVAAVLDTVNLGDKAGSYPHELSGGQRQRVALARAIICEPLLVLLDEPLAALDAELRRLMRDFLKDLQRRIKTTFVFITHDQEEAISMSDRIAVMDHGNLVQIGTPQEIYYKPKSEFVAKFFGENNLVPVSKRSSGGKTAFESALGLHKVSTDLSGDLLVAIRPESFALHDGAALGADQHILNANVQNITFLGATTLLALKIANGQIIRARIPTGKSTFGLETNSDIALRWSEADVSFLQRG